MSTPLSMGSMRCVRVWKATPGEAFGQVWSELQDLHRPPGSFASPETPPKPEGLQAARGHRSGRLRGFPLLWSIEMLNADFGFREVLGG